LLSGYKAFGLRPSSFNIEHLRTIMTKFLAPETKHSDKRALPPLEAPIARV
jgi:hypothetical protein